MQQSNPRKRGGQLGNTNARRATYQRIAPQPSISGLRLENFVARLAQELGREPSEDEVKTRAKALCEQAINDFIGQL